jgi:hypothetical protein
METVGGGASVCEWGKERAIRSKYYTTTIYVYEKSQINPPKSVEKEPGEKG